MNNSLSERALEIARANANAAVDQTEAYKDSVSSYAQNVRDTLDDEGLILERDHYKVTIRADRMSGWFERNGEAIGGLIFGILTGRDPGAIELTDYDGVFELPKTVALMLRDAGIHVDSTFM